MLPPEIEADLRQMGPERREWRCEDLAFVAVMLADAKAGLLLEVEQLEADYGLDVGPAETIDIILGALRGMVADIRLTFG